MRILHVINHVRDVGNGIVNVAVDLACVQSRSGHAVGVVSEGGEYEKLLKSYNVKCYTLAKPKSFIRLFGAFSCFYDIVKKFQPDVVHAHMRTGVILAWLARFKENYKIVTEVHNEFEWVSVLMGLGDRVIAVSNAVASSITRLGISKNKIKVVRNGTVGSPRRHPIETYEAKKINHPAIVTVAGMYERKGIGELISAFIDIVFQFPQAHLYLVGDGPDRSKFEALANKSKVYDHIHFEGFQKKPQEYLLAADIFVLASYREPCTLVLSEAREADCAIIATDVDGNPEVLDGGNAGLLVPPKNASALKEALVYLISFPEERTKLKQRALQNLEFHSVDRMAKDAEAVYFELLNKR